MNKKALLSFVLFLTITFSGFAQLNISGEFRPRLEYRNGYMKLLNEDQSPETLIHQRARINFNHKTQLAEFNLSAQDVRAWGEEKILVDNNSFSVYEAWAQFQLNEQLQIKAGRQELVYDDERLLSRRNWHNFGATYDMLLLKHQNDVQQFHIGAGYNNEKWNSWWATPYDLDFFKSLSFLWYKRQLGAINASAIGILELNEKEESTDLYGRFTYGTNLDYKVAENSVSLQGTFYHQVGTETDGTSINAFMFSSGVKWKYHNKHAFGITLDYLSGTDETDLNNTKNKTFHKLNGAFHKFYGYMELFPINQQGGLLDFYLRLSGSALKGKYQISWHQFSLPNNVLDPVDIGVEPKVLDKDLGSELDLMYDISFKQGFGLKFNYSFFLAQDSYKKLVNKVDAKDFSSFASLMLIYKFKN
ncbi:alginate export family protein [Carboxylicivirga marina]|nr:alginate export family protein [Carboxylicivirga marina]